MQKIFLSILKALGGTIKSKVIGFVVSLATAVPAILASSLKSSIKGAFNSVFTFNDMAIDTSRLMGLSFRESIGYTRILTERAKNLSVAYGITAEQIAKVQDGLAKATSRAQILTNRQTEMFVAIDKRLGENAGASYAQALVRNMGASYTTAANMAMASYAKATRVGLSAQEYSQKVVQNLALANEMSFSKGLKGIAEMTALSERLGFNMQSIKGVVDNFTDFQDAIQNAAKLQALGGNAAIYGANPLTMMYESLNDVESLTERLTKMVEGYATFDKETGIAELRGYNREMVVQIARSLGISETEAISIAKNRAKENFMETRAASALSLYAENEDFKQWIINKANFNPNAGPNGQFQITDANGRIYDISDKESVDELKQMWQQDSMSDREAFLEGARSIVKVNERLAGLQSVIGSMLAEKLIPVLNLIQEFLVKEGANVASIVGRGFAMLLNAGLWKNVGIDLATYIVGGVALAAQNIVMWMSGAVGKILMGLGWILDIISFGKAKNFSSILDGTGFAKVVMQGFSSMFTKDAQAQADIEILKHDVSELYGRTKEEYFGRLGEALKNATSSSEAYKQQINTFAPETRDVYDENNNLNNVGYSLINKDNRISQSGNKASTETYIAQEPFSYARMQQNQQPYQANPEDYARSNQAGMGGMSGLLSIPLMAGMFFNGRGGGGGAAGGNVANVGGGVPTTPINSNLYSGITTTVRNGETILIDKKTGVQLSKRQLTKLSIEQMKNQSPSVAASAQKTSWWRANPAKTRWDSTGAKMGIGIGAGLASSFIGNATTEALEKGDIKQGGLAHYAGRAASGALMGASIGSIIPGVGTLLGLGIGALAGGIYGAFSAKNEAKEAEVRAKEYREAVNDRIHNNLGQFGATELGSYYPSSKIDGKEPVATEIKAQEVGGPKSFITPIQSEVNKPQKMEVEDINININISGTLKLDTGGVQANMDMRQLASNPAFVRSITDLVRGEINKSINGGKIANDASYVSGKMSYNPMISS